MNPPFVFKTKKSPYDPRHRKHDASAPTPLISGGYPYLPSDIENQHGVGICTGGDIVQNAEKALGKKLSIDFQYLLEKKFYDLDWDEGSSILSSLKVAKNYGFLPLELFTWITEQDRLLSYNQYIAKLKAIPDVEVQRLIGLCVNKLQGYAIVNTDAQSLATGIIASRSGLLTRYEVTDEWWTDINGNTTYDPLKIDPLRHSHPIIDGHAIGTSTFDFSVYQKFGHPNTWGVEYANQGTIHTNHATYKCTEAWIPYYDQTPPPSPYKFVRQLGLYSVGTDVFKLQQVLVAGKYGDFSPTGFFGLKTYVAVQKYQIAHNIVSTGYVGVLTLAALNN